MKEFNICLVMAWVEDHKWKSQFHQREGIGIEYIAANLRNNGFNVDLINAELSYMNVQDVVEQLQKRNMTSSVFHVLLKEPIFHQSK